MAVHELTDEQIRTWTLEQKDRWWLENVYRGAMPQLTIRSALTGMILGGVLSLTNLYIGAKTGWTLGVGITSVILAFAMFKVLASLQLAEEFTILENNAMQSIATAAGYMTSPMISSLAAYMMVTNHVIPLWQTMLWITVLAILGVLFAFPFKRRFINDEQQPFPEGRAAGIVMDSLHHGEAEAGLLKAKLLVFTGLFAAGVKLLQAEAIMRWLQLQAGIQKAWHLPEFLDEWLYQFVEPPKILGTPITNLTLRPELDIPMIGAGGLMGVRTGFSILLGAFINYAILAPWMIERGDIVPNPKGTIGFREITFWSLWCGVAMMTVASLLTFFAKPQILLSAFRALWGGKPNPRITEPQDPPGTFMEEGITAEAETGIQTHRTDEAPSPVYPAGKPPAPVAGSADILGHIELPLKVSFIGIPLLGLLVVWMGQEFFGIAWWLSVIALCLVFVFCLIAINSTGLTSITPIGAMGKLTQLTFGALSNSKVVNLMTAGITGEVASNSANLLADIKPGYMLGAKPRQQAMGHVLGVLAGALLSVPVFYLFFIKDRDPVTGAETTLTVQQAFAAEGPAIRGEVGFGKEYSMPSATVWKAVADILTQGLDQISVSARWGVLAGLIVGLVFEIIRLRSHNRFPLSPVAIGLGFVIHFHTCLSMFIGSALFWLLEKYYSSKQSRVNQVVVQNQEPICAGLIAGGAIMGIIVQVIDVFFLS